MLDEWMLLDKVKEAIAALAAEFDHVLLDSAAGIEHGFEASSAPAEQALVVVMPDVTSVPDCVIGRHFDIDKAQIQLNVERQEGRQVVETSIPINGLRHL